RARLAARRPWLAAVLQPLGGEYAGTRDLLESLRFAAGYGVEIGLLLDTHAARALAAIAQVTRGVRRHRTRSLLQLGVMARQILAAALHHCGVPDAGADLTQFVQVGGGVPAPRTPPRGGGGAARGGRRPRGGGAARPRRCERCGSVSAVGTFLVVALVVGGPWW